jgi:hypothetical protein
LFIDPFLLFNSERPEYIELHKGIIKYITFLRDKSRNGDIDNGLIEAWFKFPEVKQTWLGFSVMGNGGSGLGGKFATALNENLFTIFTDFGTENVTQSGHLEKLCLIQEGVGKDNISDFSTNLIKHFLLQYTETFAKRFIDEGLRKKINVNKAYFNYETQSWVSMEYELPFLLNDYVLLTPINLLTKDTTWINKVDLLDKFHQLPESLGNTVLRSQVNNYFISQLPVDFTKSDEKKAAQKTIAKYPELIDHYIKLKEEDGDSAVNLSESKVADSKSLYVDGYKELTEVLNSNTDFYQINPKNSYDESMKRVLFLKDVVENKDGYRYFFNENGEPIRKEEDVQILYRLTWYATPYDVNREVNNGSGPVDFKVSSGSKDKNIVEFKLASNTALEQGLSKQVDIYEVANNTKQSIKVIFCFTEGDQVRVNVILKSLGRINNESIVMVDARKDNKPSASKA